MNTRRKARRSRTHAVAFGFLFAFASLLFIGLLTLSGLIKMAETWTGDLPSVVENEAFNYSEKSTVYAADGKTVLAEFQLENRSPVDSLADISTDLINATIATEDARFYEHNGIDVVGIARALGRNLLGGSLEGASTITQQLVRNTILADEMTDISLARKIREAELALEMEKYYSKDEILLMYLNTINYGDGAYGIEAAARHYFSKSAKDLTLAEAATLAGIPQSPTNLNPVVNYEGCQTRRDAVLSRMLTAGYITSAQYQEAISQDLELDMPESEVLSGIYLYPYFTTYVRSWLLDEYGTSEIFTGGLKIYTTLDVDTQEAAEQAVEDQAKRMNSALESAVVSIDPSTGYITSMVGGDDFEDNQFNVASQGGRPTGSSFKVFTLIAALEAGINPQCVIDCTSPYTLKSGLGTVENYSNIDYGWRTIESATAVSSNTGYVQLQEFLGGNKVIEVAKRLGVDTSKLMNVDTLTLGVFDITPLEMAAAYATIANGGTYYKPTAVSKILDRNGKTIYEGKQEGKRVITESVAGATTSVLQSVFTYGTATAAQLANSRPVAGKTGTTSDFRDHWLVGYTPNLACATWIGDRYNVITSEDLSCNQLFKSFMDAALASKEVKQFPAYTAPNYDNAEFNNSHKIGSNSTEEDEDEEESENSEEENKTDSNQTTERSENANQTSAASE